MFKSRPSGGMLGSVGAKIAHASTIPSLGNPELRNLQDLITAEKGVLMSFQRLAADIGKSAESLRTWGVGEGDDLGDVLSQSTNLLAHFSAALTQFASYEEQIRTQLKSIRTREEGLDEMRRRKRNVDHKADAADKKLAKMGPEHKGRPAQVELLNDLKEEGRRLEYDIVNEDTAIGDYKRRTTREFLALKFAGLVELAEKTTIIGDLGKLIIEEIPLQTTSPGNLRALYSGREKTSELSAEAQRCIGEVRLNLPVLPESVPAAPVFQPYIQPMGPPTPGGDIAKGTFGSMAPRGQGGQSSYNEFGEAERPGSGFSTGSLRIGDDGTRYGNTGMGQFHTLPASKEYSGGLPPISLGDHEREDTFSSSVADALAHDPQFSGHRDASSPNYPSAQPSSYAPPPGPPPGALQLPPTSYFSGGLLDPIQPSEPLVPPHVLSGSMPWSSAPSSPSLSRPLPTHPLEEDYERTDLAYARDPSPVPITPNKPITHHDSRPPSGHEDIYNLYEARSEAPSPQLQLPRDQPPVHLPEYEQHQVESTAPQEASWERDAPAAAQHQHVSPPPRIESLSNSSPAPPPQPLVYEPYERNVGPVHSPPSSSPFDSHFVPPSASPPLSSPHPPVLPQEPAHSPPPPQGPTSPPSEYPNPFAVPLPRPPAHLPTSPPPTVSTPPVTSPTGSRMISAGAFRRNVSRSDTLDSSSPAGAPQSVSPLSVRKKTLGGADDTSRGPSPSPASPPAPTSPGAPPTYSAIDPEGFGGPSPSTYAPASDAKQPPRHE